jgi:hypothetical protein
MQLRNFFLHGRRCGEAKKPVVLLLSPLSLLLLYVSFGCKDAWGGCML